MQLSKVISLLSLSLVLFACGTKEKPAPNTETNNSTSTQETKDSTIQLKEAWITERIEADNIDSPATWYGPNGEHWVIATAKETNALVVYDANTGKTIQRVGKAGSGKREFSRPNGIAVVDDLTVVVERDNHRLQILRLPDFESLGFIGSEHLRKPYGLTLLKEPAGSYTLYVTDNYELVEDQIPPDSALGERVRQYQFNVQGNRLSSTLVHTFGETSGEGVLRIVESIYADPANNRLLIAEEDERATCVKVYTLDGSFTGEIIGKGIHQAQTEGIALYSCGDSAGYWIITDQSHQGNTFHIYDRATLAHVGAFAGQVTANTDGIALTQTGYGDFPSGTFFAVHDDGGVASFSWDEIAQKLSLRSDCN